MKIVRFSGGSVFFSQAQFSGSEVDFYAAIFSAGLITFLNTVFSGGKVTFEFAQFRGTEVLFPAKFSGGTVDFSRVADWSRPPHFDWKGTPPAGVKVPLTEGPEAPPP